jgi:uncharacterized protein (TIGR03086 family)
MPPSDQVQFQASAIRELIANTSSAQLSGPTPCTKWTVHDLINHMVGGGMIFGAGLRGDKVEMDPDGDLPDFLGEDPVAAWDLACETFMEGADTPGALDRVVSLPYGDMPGALVLEIAKVDLLIHGWDLAQATGQAYDPPADVVEPALGAARNIIVDAIRNGDTFKDEVKPTAGASQIDQLAAFAGRSIG